MIDSGFKLFGYPVRICEPGETPGGDKNLPAVKRPDGGWPVPPDIAEQVEKMKPGDHIEGDKYLVKILSQKEFKEKLLAAELSMRNHRAIRKLDARWRWKGIVAPKIEPPPLVVGPVDRMMFVREIG